MLSWNEIRHRSIAFSRDNRDTTSEKPESQTFWNEFFNIFGIKQHKLNPGRSSEHRGHRVDGPLHGELKNSGFSGHDLLMRLFFYLFADDTGSSFSILTAIKQTVRLNP